MVPKLHPKGSSFKGAAAYLLHDKGRASSAERLAWVETRNLATNEPEVAWRVMAATAMDQARLKEAAGIKKTGRKSKKSVLHFSLSWHEEEGELLSREEMLRAASGAIAALGGEIEAGRQKVVGLNAFTEGGDDSDIEILKIGEGPEARQRERLAGLRDRRDDARVASTLARLREAARDGENVLEPMLECVRAYCTLFEIRYALEKVHGAYREPVFF